MSGNFLSCSKDPFEFPEFRCDESPEASEEMGLITPGAENLLDFLELGRVSRVRRRNRGSSGCGRDSRASSRVETGMSGNFLSCSKGVKDDLEVPEFSCD